MQAPWTPWEMSCYGRGLPLRQRLLHLSEKYGVSETPGGLGRHLWEDALGALPGPVTFVAALSLLPWRILHSRSEFQDGTSALTQEKGQSALV